MTETVHHLKVEFTTAALYVGKYYALDAATWRKAQAWQAGQSSLPTAQEFADWLDRNGGKLDRADGPAVIRTYPDGSRIEEWCRDGAHHRTDGPAVIATYADGTRTEAWWKKGKLIKRETLADPAAIPGVTILPPQP